VGGEEPQEGLRRLLQGRLRYLEAIPEDQDRKPYKHQEQAMGLR